jgi:hypothetical protein
MVDHSITICVRSETVELRDQDLQRTLARQPRVAINGDSAAGSQKTSCVKEYGAGTERSDLSPHPEKASMRSTRSEAQERIRRARDQAATAIAQEYGLRYVDMRALLERMTAEEIRRILEEQGVKRVLADDE